MNAVLLGRAASEELSPLANQMTTHDANSGGRDNTQRVGSERAGYEGSTSDLANLAGYAASRGDQIIPNLGDDRPLGAQALAGVLGLD